MRAAVLAGGRVEVREVTDPVPGPGQVLARVRACGVCGSDLHFAGHGARMVELSHQMGAPLGVNLGQDVYFGHEFAAEVLAAGPDTDLPVPEGALVTSLPLLLGPAGEPQPILYSNQVHGGYGELLLLSAPLLLPVPNGLPAHLAALTEPMAVGLHAVNAAGFGAGADGAHAGSGAGSLTGALSGSAASGRPGPGAGSRSGAGSASGAVAGGGASGGAGGGGDAGSDAGALVLGCGPVGLAVIAALKVAGVAPIVAADYSATRRELAGTMGADVVADPREQDGWAAWAGVAGGRELVVFEAIGVPGILDGILRAAPPRTRVVVVGVCMEQDSINPFFGIAKELSVRFVFAYSPEEFAESLRRIAEGEVDVSRLVTARVPLEQTAWAFDALGGSTQHCKIMIEP